MRREQLVDLCALLLALTFMASCADEPHSEPARDAPTFDAGASSAAVDASDFCAQFGREPCDRPGYCRRGGRRIDRIRGCIGEPEPVGCADYANCGGDAVVVARDARGDLWYFGTDCVPNELTPTRDPLESAAGNFPFCDPGPVDPILCREYATNACPTEQGCVELHAIHDPRRRCRRAQPAVIGCHDETEPCEPKTTHAARLLSDQGPISPTEDHYELPTTCIPPKFGTIPDPPEPSVTTWPPCAQ